MKKIIYIILLVCSLNGNNEVINNKQEELPKATQLEMFLFKIGFTSLLEDFEKEKDITSLNTDDIKQLQKNVKYILQIMNKNKLEEQSSFQTLNNKNEDRLLLEIQSLRDELNLLKLDIKSKKEKHKELSKVKIIKVRVKEANTRKSPFIDSKVIDKLYFGEIVDIEFCNSYGWCKLKNKKQYIAKFLLYGF